jgi:glutamyl-Q tRNA(Asp) synthetase
VNTVAHTIAPYIGRFAPSPSGPLHFGSLVAALASYLDAKAHSGLWRVRIEDVDETRCKAVHADDILRTLSQFHLNWDGDVVTQSLRKPAYEQALARLSMASPRSVTYACSCSRKEIADSTINAGNGLEDPIYPGTCRVRLSGDVARENDAGLAIRVVTNNKPIAFTDRVQGEICQYLDTVIGDFVVKRRDGLFAYQLAVVVDDAAESITDVVRGADLLDSTARQIYLQQLLNLTTPRYLHIPVATNSAGQKLSKQTLAPGIATADRVRTIEAALQFLGQSKPVPTASITALLEAAVKNWNVRAIPRTRTIAIL